MRTSLDDILADFLDAVSNNRHLGDHFELLLLLRFLEVDPLYAERFS